MLNVDIKILSKAPSKKIERGFTMPIIRTITAYVQNRNISENGRIISDITEITNIRQMEGFLVTMDVEKAFDSLDHKFLISV